MDLHGHTWLAITVHFLCYSLFVVYNPRHLVMQAHELLLSDVVRCYLLIWLDTMFTQLTKREGSTMRTPMPRIAISSGPSARLVLPNMSFSSTISGKTHFLVELSRFAKIAFLHVKVSWCLEQTRLIFLERDGHYGVWRQNVQRRAC